MVENGKWIMVIFTKLQPQKISSAPSLYMIGTLSTVSGDLLFIAISRGLPRLNKHKTANEEGSLLIMSSGVARMIVLGGASSERRRREAF